MPQQGLWSHDDERFAERAGHLPAQQVEIICRRGAVCDLDIILGTQLQEAFKPR